MKKVNQKIKNYTANVNVVNNNNLQKKMAHFMVTAFLGLALCYLLILINMVWDIVDRKAFQAEAFNLSSQVGQLELKYLTLSDKIDVGMSKEMGFREVKPSFATPSKPIGAVAKVTNEI